jgi:hypothetical protein
VAIAIAVAVARPAVCSGGSQVWCGSFQCGVDEIESRLHVGRASELHFQLTPLALNLDALFLDKLSVLFKLRAQCVRTGHLSPCCVMRV